MARFTKFRVWHEARTLLRIVSQATSDMRAEGNLKSQLRRAAISVVSNISEGCERGSDREFARFLAIATASNAEVEAQAMIAADLTFINDTTGAEIVAQCRIVGRMLSGLIVRLTGSG